MKELINKFIFFIKKKNFKVKALIMEVNLNIVAFTKSLNDFTFIIIQIIINCIIPKKIVIFNIICFKFANKARNVFGLVYTTIHINSDNKIIKEVNI